MPHRFKATTENKVFCPRYSGEPAASDLEAPHPVIFPVEDLRFPCFIEVLIDFKSYKNNEVRS